MMPILSVRDLHVNFGGVKPADGVELDIHAGEIVAIIGPNGSGKTTFINLCTGYVNPARGSVLFDGQPITNLPPRKIARRGIARAFQIPQLFTGHSLLENVMLAVAAQSDIWQPMGPLDRKVYREAALRILDLLALNDAADQQIAMLPEGLRKLADIAIAIALKPRLLLLDEPTSGVSTAEKTPLMDTIVAMLRAERMTALFVEHDMDVVERYADRVFVWDTGRVVASGHPREVLHNPNVIERVVGVG
jgi:branched-chain amino acid transport system ATP-binding protein